MCGPSVFGAKRGLRCAHRHHQGVNPSHGRPWWLSRLPDSTDHLLLKEFFALSNNRNKKTYNGIMQEPPMVVAAARMSPILGRLIASPIASPTRPASANGSAERQPEESVQLMSIRFPMPAKQSVTTTVTMLVNKGPNGNLPPDTQETIVNKGDKTTSAKYLIIGLAAAALVAIEILPCFRGVRLNTINLNQPRQEADFTGFYQPANVDAPAISGAIYLWGGGVASPALISQRNE